jgi:tight adherence protein C
MRSLAMPVAGLERRFTLLGRRLGIGRGVWAHVVDHATARWAQDPATRQLLVRAGFRGDDAPLAYAAVRVALLAVLPASTALLALRGSTVSLALAVAVVLSAAGLIPVVALRGLVRRRQSRIRRAIPDALDLLLVCVEAGSGVGPAIEYVARSMVGGHSELAAELTEVARQTRAGESRAHALRGLYARTGVEELRVLGSSIVRSERLGTSVAEALHAAADMLRTTRRYSAEQCALASATRTAIVLVTVVLPALFVVVLGPSLLGMLSGHWGSGR